jgi:hypothetical protein
MFVQAQQLICALNHSVYESERTSPDIFYHILNTEIPLLWYSTQQRNYQIACNNNQMRWKKLILLVWYSVGRVSKIPLGITQVLQYEPVVCWFVMPWCFVSCLAASFCFDVSFCTLVLCPNALSCLAALLHALLFCCTLLFRPVP